MEKPITGVYLIDSLGSGGAQRQLVELVKNIDRHIIKPIVVTYHDFPFFLDELNSYGVETLLLTKYDKVGITFMAQFISFLRRIKPRFIHSFLNTPNFYARLAKLAGTVKIVITSERSISLGYSGYLKWLEKLTWPLSDGIVANAEAVKRKLTEQLGIPAAKVYIVNNGLQVEHFKEFNPIKVKSIRDKMEVGSNGESVIGLIGRMTVEKNHGGLLEAISLIKNNHPELFIKLGFWGAEPEIEYAKSIRAQCLKYELEDTVFFWGQEKDMASVYAACDLVVLPSLFEGFPNVVIEAMAASKIVIASNVADNARIIKDGENGFIVPPNSPERLSQKIIEVILLPSSDKARITEQAQQMVSQRYSIERMVNNTMAVYNELHLC
jgi:glycosyltransferase involved in cell wall biosynthesis